MPKFNGISKESLMHKRILVIAAHPDDETLGCAGTIAKMIDHGFLVRLCVLSSGEGARNSDNTIQKKESLEKVKNFLKIEKIYQFNFRDNQFDTHSLLEITKAIETVANEFNPEIVYTHSSHDLNIDHRLTHQATMTAFRTLPNKNLEKILSYEVLSSTEYAPISFFKPNYFEQISSVHLAKKLNAMEFYHGEIRQFPHPRSLKAIEAQAITRGSSVGVEYAEAFSIEREISRM